MPLKESGSVKWIKGKIRRHSKNIKPKLRILFSNQRLTQENGIKLKLIDGRPQSHI